MSAQLAFLMMFAHNLKHGMSMPWWHEFVQLNPETMDDLGAYIAGGEL
jgi:hypothetical protein